MCVYECAYALVYLVFLSVSLYARLPTCFSPVCLPACVSVYLSISLPCQCTSVRACVCLCVGMFVGPCLVCFVWTLFTHTHIVVAVRSLAVSDSPPLFRPRSLTRRQPQHGPHPYPLPLPHLLPALSRGCHTSYRTLSAKDAHAKQMVFTQNRGRPRFLQNTP